MLMDGHIQFYIDQNLINYYKFKNKKYKQIL